MSRRPGRVLPAALAWFGLTAPAAAQDVKASREVPPDAAAEAIAFFNRAQTIRVTGEFRVPAGSAVGGDLAVLGGPLVVAGQVRGRVVVINGDAHLEPGAELLGDLTVIGGVLSGPEDAVVSGAVIAYPAPIRVREQDGHLVQGTLPSDAGLSAGYDLGFGRVDLGVAVRGSYNRIEGLPVAFGPRFDFGGSNPTRLEALLIYRTAFGLKFDEDELGYVVRLEQFLGGQRALRLGALLRSEIASIEAWGLADRENSLATFLLHRDYRDHYERQGWAGYLRFAPPAEPYDVTLEYAEEEHDGVSSRGPWALFDNHEDWRPQPVIAEGMLRSAALRLTYDTRNDEIAPSAGWQVRAELERGLGGTLDLPVLPDPDGDTPGAIALTAPDEFTAGFLDVRRYVRTGPDSRLGIRVLAAGSVDGDALPPQRQHTLGGEGSLPGYRLFAFDCGARTQSVPDLFPYYGCDRLALVQLEYSGELPFAGAWLEERGRDLGLAATPRWALFFDAGRAWTEPSARRDRLGGQNDFAADAGVGLQLGRLGAYWAVPLSGQGQGVNFFIRIGRRF